MISLILILCRSSIIFPNRSEIYLDFEVGLIASSEGMSVVERFLLGSTTVLICFAVFRRRSLHAIMLLTGWLECQRLPLRFLWPSHLKVKCYGWVIIFQFYQSLWSQSSCDRKWKLCKWREMPRISSHNRKLSSREIEFGQKITWASISSTEGGNDFG